MVAVFKKELEWKEFNVNLDKVNTELKTIDANICGLQAHSVLEVWFTEAPSESTLNDIEEYWAALDEESEEATSYVSQAAIAFAMEAARSDAASKAWDVLSAQQKKMIASAPLLQADVEALVAAFPVPAPTPEPAPEPTPEPTPEV